MLSFFKKRFIQILLTLFCAASFCGCDIIQEALEEGSGSTDPNSEDFRPRFVVGVFSIVQYPRATELEREIQSLDGQTITINTNQNFSSKNLRDARVVPRPGNPEICDLQFKLDRRGKVLWQLLAGSHMNEPVVLAVDSRYTARFIPELPADEESDWVTLRVGIDHYTARGIAKYAKKNYTYYNPNTKSWFE